MKRYTFLSLYTLLSAALLFASCNNDGDLLTTSGADNITLAGSGDIVLSSNTPDALALTLYWNGNGTLSLNDPEVLAPENATANTLQFSATEAFDATVEYLMENAATSVQYTMESLNSIVGRLGFEGDVAAPLYIRMKSVLANNLDASYSNTLVIDVTPYTLDMTIGYVLTSAKEETGNTLASPDSDGIYAGFLGVAGWYNWYLKDGAGIVWGNDGDTGTPFMVSSSDTQWNFWYPGLEGCYYTVVNTNTLEWSALFIQSLNVSGDISGEMTYTRKTNQWTYTFTATAADTKTIQLSGDGLQYNISTDTSDDAAIATDVAFAQEGERLIFGTMKGNITVNIPQAGEVTLTLDLSDPKHWTCTVETGGAVVEETPQYLYMSGIDDGISGSWTFDNYLVLYNEDELSYAGLCNVNSLWGYLYYTEADNWSSNYGCAWGDAHEGGLESGSTANIVAPEPGLYLMVASIGNLTYSNTPVNSVQITGIGDDWTLVEMTPTETAGVYTCTLNVTASTPWGFQIVLNEDWSTYFGGSEGVLKYQNSNIPLDDSYIGSTVCITADLCKGTYSINN